MNVKKILRKKKAVSTVIATVFLIGVAITAAGIVYSSMNIAYDSQVDEAGVITAEDYDNAGEHFDAVVSYLGAAKMYESLGFVDKVCYPETALHHETNLHF